MLAVWRDSGGPLNQRTTGDVKRGSETARRPYPRRAAERGGRRRSGPVVVSIALHVLVGAALVRVLLIPYPLIFGPKEQPVEPERISFLALPEASPTPSSGKSGGNARPVTPGARPAPPIVAPTEV